MNYNLLDSPQSDIHFCKNKDLLEKCQSHWQLDLHKVSDYFLWWWNKSQDQCHPDHPRRSLQGGRDLYNCKFHVCKYSCTMFCNRSLSTGSLLMYYFEIDFALLMDSHLNSHWCMGTFVFSWQLFGFWSMFSFLVPDRLVWIWWLASCLGHVRQSWLLKI